MLKTIFCQQQRVGRQHRVTLHRITVENVPDRLGWTLVTQSIMYNHIQPLHFFGKPPEKNLCQEILTFSKRGRISYQKSRRVLDFGSAWLNSDACVHWTHASLLQIQKGNKSVHWITTPPFSTVLMLDKWRTHQGRLLMLIATEPKFATEPKGSIWQRDLQVLSAVPHIASSEYCGNIYATQIAPILLNFGQCRAFYSRHGLLSGFVWQLSGATTRLWD